MKLLLAVILISLCVLLVDSALLKGSLQEELDIYEGRIRIIYRLLKKECPSALKSRRQVTPEDQRLHLLVQKQLYTRLLRELSQCRKFKSLITVKVTTSSTANVKPTTTTEVKPTLTTTEVKPTTTTTEVKPKTTEVKPTSSTAKVRPTATTEVKPTTTTEVKPTTFTEVKPTTTTEVKPTTTEVKPTKPLQPIECQQATNYTQSWRRDYKGSDIRTGGPNARNGYACDLHVTNTEWFRFAGEAGNRMLDKCPKWKSCGTEYPFWTDAEMPKVVGVESTVDVYEVGVSDCKSYTRQVKVMRCSRDTEYDFIYKQTTNYSGICAGAFCGMF